MFNTGKRGFGPSKRSTRPWRRCIETPVQHGKSGSGANKPSTWQCRKCIETNLLNEKPANTLLRTFRASRSPVVIRGRRVHADQRATHLRRRQLTDVPGKI